MRRGQVEAVAAIAIAVMIALFATIAIRFSLMYRQAVVQQQQLSTREVQKLSEFVSFRLELSEEAVYGTPTLANTIFIYRAIINTSHVLWSNVTDLSLDQDTCVFKNTWINRDLVTLIRDCKARLVAVSARGRLFVWCPQVYPTLIAINSTTLRTFLMPSGSYEVYTARTQYVVLNASYVGSFTISGIISGYIYYSYSLSGGITSLLTPIYVFYYGDVKISEKNWIQGNTLYTQLNITDALGSRYYTIVIDERGNVVYQSSSGVSKAYDAYLVVPGLSISNVEVYTFGAGDFVVMWLKLENGYIYVYTSGGSRVRLGEASMSISSSGSSQTTITIDSATKTLLSNARLYVVYSYSMWRWPPYSLDEYRITMEPSSLSLVLVDPRTMYGRGIAVVSAQNVVTDSRRVAGYIYNLNPPVLLQYTGGTLTSTASAWNLNTNQPLTHFVNAITTVTIGGKQFRAMSKVNMSITVSEGSIPPPSTQPTPTPIITPPPLIGKIIAEQSPVPTNSTPIDTTITLRTDNKWLADNALIEYEVFDLALKDSIRGTGRFYEAEWSYTLKGVSMKYIRITIKVKDAELYKAIFYNYLKS